MSLSAGLILQQRYEIVRSIKSGGMGAVYEAIDRKLADTPCAVKEVLAQALAGPDADYILASFEAEMRALAKLEHPSIPRVRDYFEVDGKRYIILDLVRGQGLDDELEEHVRVTGEPMDPEVAAVDMVDVLDTLSYLHSLQPPIVHRDIKPANLIRDQRTQKIKLVDFGIARSVDTGNLQTQVGTPGYCAPEQMTGRAEPRSDLFSVGSTLYILVTGQKPPLFAFEPLRPELPGHPGLSTIIEKATQLKAADRYANCSEMAEALRCWLKGETRVQPIHPLARPEPAANSATPARWAMLLGILALLGGAATLWRGAAPTAVTASPTPSRTMVSIQDVPTPSPTPVASVEEPEVASSPDQPAPAPAPAPAPDPPTRPVALQPPSQPPELRASRPLRRLAREFPNLEERTGNYPRRGGRLRQAAAQRLNGLPPDVSQARAVASLPADIGPFHLEGDTYVGPLGGSECRVQVVHLPGQDVQSILRGRGITLTDYTPSDRPLPAGEVCSYRQAGNTHYGIHVKDNYFFDIRATPIPDGTANWNTLNQVVDSIR